MKCSGSINLLPALECLQTDIHIMIHFWVLSGTGWTELQMCKLLSFLFKKMYLQCKSICICFHYKSFVETCFILNSSTTSITNKPILPAFSRHKIIMPIISLVLVQII
jgi:hypothetical protein